MNANVDITGLVWRPLIGLAATIAAILGLAHWNRMPIPASGAIVVVSLAVVGLAIVATARQVHRLGLDLR